MKSQACHQKGNGKDDPCVLSCQKNDEAAADDWGSVWYADFGSCDL